MIPYINAALSGNRRIVKKLVNMLEGTVTVKSKLEEGTTFIIRLPYRVAKPIDMNKMIPILLKYIK